ncbi:MAG TPA: hypothetical protein VJM32_00740 [Candidatus Saccharimonadales bacterium]|nr:hypothetical protein [Candidatus Saccharimonadales bacterium]
MAAKRLPTWEQLGAVIPQSVLEAQARIVHLMNEIGGIDEQLKDPLPPEKRSGAYKQWLVAAHAARRQKQYELRRLRVWEQDYNAKAGAARKLNRMEEQVGHAISAAGPDGLAEAARQAHHEALRQQVNDRLGGDLIAMGMALKSSVKAWGVLIRIATAAKEYVDAESRDDSDEEVLDAAFEALVASLEEAVAKGYLPSLVGAAAE